ncbi:MAG: TetR/AcrR family transcriptional regulator [Spirochaetales bacterium]|nr:TetR/AcrR family transcriptional regulator [Spirochaetales bacterium]
MKANKEIQTKILEVARKKFFTLGIKGVTMDEIAAESGIGKATLYENFSSKNDLVEELIKVKVYEMETYLNTITEKLKEDENLDLINTIRMLIDFGDKELREMKEPFLAEVKKFFFPASDKLRYSSLIKSIIKEIIHRGIKDKIIRSDCNINVLIETIILIVEDIITNREVAQKYNISSSEVMDTIMKLIIGGLLTEDTRSKYSI